MQYGAVKMEETVCVGDKFVDNDHRTKVKGITVIGVDGDYAICYRANRKVKILIRRLLTGGNRGYTKVRSE